MKTTQETNPYSINAIVAETIERARREWDAPSYSHRTKVRRTHTLASLAREIAESMRLFVSEPGMSHVETETAFNIEIEKAIAAI